MAVEPYIIRDLSTKLADDLDGAIKRTSALLPFSQQGARLQVVVIASVTAIEWIGACIRLMSPDPIPARDVAWLSAFMLARYATGHGDPITQARKDYEAFAKTGVM